MVRPGNLLGEPGGNKALVFDQGNRITMPISCADVADVCVKALHDEEARNKSFDVCYEYDAGAGGEAGQAAGLTCVRARRVHSVTALAARTCQRLRAGAAGVRVLRALAEHSPRPPLLPLHPGNAAPGLRRRARSSTGGATGPSPCCGAWAAACLLQRFISTSLPASSIREARRVRARGSHARLQHAGCTELPEVGPRSAWRWVSV